MGYPMLPGEPLLRRKFAEIARDATIVDRIATELAGFLRALHAIPPASLGPSPPAQEPRGEWAALYDEFRRQRFHFMRPQAREAVSRSFGAALADAGMWAAETRLIHGDFGTGNLLFEAGRISGVIDFGFCGLGDPAQDLGALIASYGEAFARRVVQRYPALGAGWRRARFYREHYALIQALYARRDGDEAEFADGMRDYV